MAEVSVCKRLGDKSTLRHSEITFIPEVHSGGVTVYS